MISAGAVYGPLRCRLALGCNCVQQIRCKPGAVLAWPKSECLKAEGGVYLHHLDDYEIQYQIILIATWRQPPCIGSSPCLDRVPMQKETRCTPRHLRIVSCLHVPAL